MIVMPLTKTDIDWQALMKATSESMGRSVTRSLDAAKIKPESTFAYLAALGEFKKQGSPVLDVIRDPGSLLRHLWYGFYVAAGKQVFFEIMESSDLDALVSSSLRKDIKVGIVSGNLEVWRSAIINGCSRHSSENLKTFYNQCLTIFDKEGFSGVWSGYSRTKNGAQLLLEKK